MTSLSCVRWCNSYDVITIAQSHAIEGYIKASHPSSLSFEFRMALVTDKSLTTEMWMDHESLAQRHTTRLRSTDPEETIGPMHKKFQRLRKSDISVHTVHHVSNKRKIYHDENKKIHL